MKAVNAGWYARWSPCAPGVSRSDVHVCQNFIFMASIIHKVDFSLANAFFLKIVCLTLSTCHYGLTSL